MNEQPTLIQISSLAFSIGDAAAVLVVVVALIGVIVATRQLKNGNDIQQAVFFKELYFEAFVNEDTLRNLAMIEYHRFKFGDGAEKSQEFQEMEVQVNALLGFAAGLCTLKSLKRLPEKEMKKFEYFLTVLYKEPAVQRYLVHLAKVEAAQIGKSVVPYASFIDYCENTLRLGGLPSSTPANSQLQQ